MNNEARKAWVAALRSGEYKQGIAQLRCGDEFCCLGVICDVHSKITGTKWVQIDAEDTYEDMVSEPPESVMRWAELMPDDVQTLINMNDVENKTFHEIADYIEKEL